MADTWTSSAKTNSDQIGRNVWCRRGVLICLVLQFLLACDTGRRLTATHDEYWHLPLGLLMWKAGQFDYDVINPPLVRLWAALPLIVGGAKLDTAVPFSFPRDTGDLFWMSNPEYRMFWYALGRMMIAILNGSTGWLLALWGRRWFGDFAGLAVCLLWCCCPTILANGSLVTHDAASVLGFVMTFYAVVCWSEQPSWRRAAVTGFCLGIAQLMKVTCVLLFPLSIVVWFLITWPFTADQISRLKWKAWIGQWMIVFLVAIVVINAGYLGQQTFRPLKSMNFGSQRFQQLQQIAGLNSIPIPIPQSHVRAFDRVAQDLQQKHAVYLDGQCNDRGYLTYYVEALAYKLPLGAWVMFGLSVWMCCVTQNAGTIIKTHFRDSEGSEKRVLNQRPTRQEPHPPGAVTTSNDIAKASEILKTDALKQSDGTIERLQNNVEAPIGIPSTRWQKQLVLWIPILALVVPASLGSNQIGIRYILPALPFFYLFASQAAAWFAAERRQWRHVFVLIALISLPFSLRYHPHHLTYFNEWAGGPDEGKQLLADSNLDWGQDLHGLAEYLRENKINRLGLAYYGTVHPHSLGIAFQVPPGRKPQPGDYAISANFLVGRPFVLRAPTANGEAPIPTIEHPNQSIDFVTVPIDEFGYFRFFQPRAIIGHSIYVYHLTVEDVAAYQHALQRAQRL